MIQPQPALSNTLPRCDSANEANKKHSPFLPLDRTCQPECSAGRASLLMHMTLISALLGMRGAAALPAPAQAQDVRGSCCLQAGTAAALLSA